jgi:hypothetical protein
VGSTQHYQLYIASFRGKLPSSEWNKLVQLIDDKLYELEGVGDWYQSLKRVEGTVRITSNVAANKYFDVQITHSNVVFSEDYVIGFKSSSGVSIELLSVSGDGFTIRVYAFRGIASGSSIAFWRWGR